MISSPSSTILMFSPPSNNKRSGCSASCSYCANALYTASTNHRKLFYLFRLIYVTPHYHFPSISMGRLIVTSSALVLGHRFGLGSFSDVGLLPAPIHNHSFLWSPALGHKCKPLGFASDISINMLRYRQFPPKHHMNLVR